MASTARFGRAGGTTGVSVQFDARSLITLTDRITGKFLKGGFQKALASVHLDAAAKIQTGMVEELRTRVAATGRTQRGTNYLELALLDERNRNVTASEFAVLLPSWLDSGESHVNKYWRRIEEGDQTTFNGYVLFTNNIDGGKRYGPWSPGGSSTGHSATSANRTARSGNNQLYSRPMPLGYKHMRMPQHSGIYVQGIGPFPEYAYSRGGERALLSYPFAAQYTKALNSVGIKVDAVLR